MLNEVHKGRGARRKRKRTDLPASMMCYISVLGTKKAF
jgi:hypothetical protein